MTSALRTGADLLAVLESHGPRPALAWRGEESRIELSGHVLANWVTKTIGHLDAEIGLLPGDLVVLDLPPHWKRLVIALAAWSLGARVEIGGGERDEEPRLVATDAPERGAAQAAEDVLALDAASLAPRFSGTLPPLVHDWAQEVRAHPDRLGTVLPAWSGPAPTPAPEGAVPRPSVTGDGLEEISAALGAWWAGGGIVGPAATLDAQALADEQVTGPAGS